jgi:DNA-directed RNA polymerase specialized sigma24 family protein
MSTVALPASAAGGGLGSQAEFARLAARGDEEAFAEVFSRHGQFAWRLAQAVANYPEAARAAVCEGFVAALKELRRHPRQGGGDQAFRLALLGSVYRAAVREVHEHPQATRPSVAAPARGRSRSKAADVALLESAFRSLPERWRAALWLSEVEVMPIDSVGSALGVSGAVAAQLLTRAQRGLAGRFAQARRPMPEQLGAALRPLTAPIPASLSDDAAESFRELAGVPVARLAPLGAWLSEHSERPLQITAAVLLALGLVGLGVEANAGHTKAGPAATGNAPAAHGSFSVPKTSFGIPITSPGALGAAPGLGAATLAGAGLGSSGTGQAATSGGGGGGGSVTGSAGGQSTSSPNTSGGGLAHSGTGGPTSGGQPTHSAPPASNPGTTLNLGVATVNINSGGIQAKVLPTSSGGSAANATVGQRSGCQTGISITVGTVTLGCSLSSPIQGGSSATSNSSTQSVSQVVGSAVDGATKTVTSVAGALNSSLGLP